MRIGVLGPLEVLVEGEPVEIGGTRLRALLIRLALDAGRTVGIAALADAVWDDRLPADRVNALQSLVSRLRKALPSPDLIHSDSAGYRLDMPATAVDAVYFEQLATEGRRALEAGNASTAAGRLRAALVLWRGPALADVADAAFAQAPVTRLAERRLAATEDLFDATLATGYHAEIVGELEALVREHPLRERLRGQLLIVLYRVGRQAEALESYEEFRQLLADELGADPSERLQRIHLAVLRAETEPAESGVPTERKGPTEPGAAVPDGPITQRAVAAPASRATPRTGLPVALTSFVGRDEERARVAERLRDGRLVTLVGPGGAGKTRLASTVSAAMAADFGDRVWFVELASATDAASLTDAVAGALGVREINLPEMVVAPRDADGRIVDALAHGDALLVLDNCEHLLDPAAHLVDDLLRCCPGLRVLVTSREPLGVTGEALCPVPPLGLPRPDVTVAETAAAPAVRLFVDRAGAVRPGFTVTDANVGAVVEICRRLDGLPLAIELAAARLGSLTVDQVAERLDDRFRLLGNGSRTAVPRHRALHAVVDWSWQLLHHDERRLAERLAVFPASFTLEAAVQVGEQVAEFPDRLASLVDKSLVQLVDDAGPRYRMLETIREFARRRLADSGDLDKAAAAHAAYFLDVAERADPDLRGGDHQPSRVRELAAERDNLQAALSTACESGDAGTAVRLAAALGLFWTVADNHAEAAARIRAALDVPGESPLESRVVATVYYLLNDFLAGASSGEEASRAIELVSPTNAAHPAVYLLEPVIALCTGDRRAGEAAVERLLPAADPWTRAMLLLVVALLHGSGGDLSTMSRDLSTAADAFREARERWGLAQALGYLGYGLSTAGRFSEAIDAMEEAIAVLRELDEADEAVLQRVMLAETRASLGDVAQARVELEQLIAPGAGVAGASSRVFARIVLGDLARRNGELEEAARHYDAAGDDLRAGTSAPAFHAMLLAGYGHLAIDEGRLEAARRYLADAIVRAKEAPDPPIEAMVGVAVARLRRERGDAPDAATVLGAADVLRGAPGEFDPDVVQLVEALRAELGERDYTDARHRGRDLDRADVYALLAAAVRTGAGTSTSPAG